MRMVLRMKWQIFALAAEIPGACVRPPPRGGPRKPPFARFGVRWVSAMLRSLLCDTVRYGVCSVLSVWLSCCVSCQEGGRSVGTTLSESKILCSSSMLAIAFWGRFPWWGDACVSRYHGPSTRLSERRGGPWAPPPLVLLILLTVCCSGRC